MTLVTEVATRALKAVWFQKWNVHLRLRPEALAARLAFFTEIEARYGSSDLVRNLNEMKQVLSDVIDLLPAIDKGLLPMAFPEGSPMHPAYGAGHATVAGACVTIVKAFFDHHDELVRVHKEAENIKLENQKSEASPIPWHPGAVKYFAEKGIKIR